MFEIYILLLSRLSGWSALKSKMRLSLCLADGIIKFIIWYVFYFFKFFSCLDFSIHKIKVWKHVIDFRKAVQINHSLCEVQLCKIREKKYNSSTWLYTWTKWKYLNGKMSYPFLLGLEWKLIILFVFIMLSGRYNFNKPQLVERL